MKKTLLLLSFITICSALVGCSDKSEENLCINDLITEMVSTRFGEEHETQELWAEIKERGYVSKTGDEKTKNQFTSLQFLFESSLASMLKDKQISRIISVNYTQKPVTALRTDGTNLDSLLSLEDLKNPTNLSHIVSRYESIHEYLSNGGVMYNVYEDAKTDDKIPGINVYYNNLKKYSDHLIDKPTDKFEVGIGNTTYLIQCDNGQFILFSMSSKVLSDSETNWHIYYGSIYNHKIEPHYQALKHLYKKHGIEFKF